MNPTNSLATPKPTEPVLRKDFLPSTTTKPTDSGPGTTTAAATTTTTTTTTTSIPPGAKNSTQHSRSQQSRNMLLNQSFINAVPVTQSLSARIMQNVSSDEVDAMIRRIKGDIKPLLQRCQDQDTRIETLKESLHPHILSTRTAVSHLSYLASRAKKTSELMDHQSRGFIQLARDDIHRQIESDAVGREKDFSDTQSDLLGDDQLELARSKLSEANKRLEKHIARQRHYEMKLASHLSILRRLILILLTIKILIDMKITNQVMQFIHDLVPTPYIPSLLAPKPTDDLVLLQAHPPGSSSTPHDDQHGPKKNLSDFLAYLIWIVMIKLELF